MRFLIAFGVFVAASASGFAVEQTYDGGFEPKPPSPFPAVYQDYQILPNTISPDHKYAFIYPKRSRLYELSEPGLYLAVLEPVRVLTKITTGYSSLAGNSHGYYAASWAKNSSAAIFIAGTKWGPDKVWLIRLQNGRMAKRTDLAFAVRQQVLRDFKK